MAIKNWEISDASLINKFGDASMGIMGPVGSVFYVDTGTGSDTNAGTDPGAPKATITSALSSCTANKNDYIFLLYYSGTGEAAYPVSIEKADVHLLGLGSRSVHGNHRVVLNGNTGNAMAIAMASPYTAEGGAGIEIAGINFISTGAAGIYILDWWVPWNWIHHCGFGISGVLQDGILVTTDTGAGRGGDLSYSTIEDCYFGHGLTRDGIGMRSVSDQAGTFTWSFVRRCIFRGQAGIGINFVSTNSACRGGGFLDNIFACKDEANGEAITISGAQEIMVMGNRAGSGMLNSGWTYNPYKDLAANTTNDWSMNWRGNSVIEPVGV